MHALRLLDERDVENRSMALIARRSGLDLLLAHGFFLCEDAKERRIMKPYPPLGILYLSSFLKQRGFNVGVFDSTFRRRDEFVQLLRRERPPVVGLSCNLMTKRSVLAMARAARDEGVFVVVGGPDPPHYAEEYLAHGADVVVIGEGEETLEELLRHLRRVGPVDMDRIRGLVYRDRGGRLHRTPPRPLLEDLDRQPFPDRTATAIGEYVEAWRDRHGLGSVSVICSRGCPYTCTWCSRSVFGETHRRRSPSNVADEVEQIVHDYRPDMLWYADDVFTISHRWLFDYAAELKRRGLRIPFECISRADRLTDPVVRTLAEMGCLRLWIGSESGSQRILDAMERRVRVEQVRTMTHVLKQHGIATGMFIMLGYDGEELQDLEATVEHLKASDPDVFVTTVAYPIKGTPYYDRLNGRIAAARGWTERTDRDLIVTGRRSRRFYSFVAQWMTGEVALHKQRHGTRTDYVKLAKGLFNAHVGRAGMKLTG
jgi:anaerobic magnesium-protoporphyrin IX monomethyl ester cyclase